MLDKTVFLPEHEAHFTVTVQQPATLSCMRVTFRTEDIGLDNSTRTELIIDCGAGSLEIEGTDTVARLRFRGDHEQREIADALIELAEYLRAYRQKPRQP